MMLFIARLSAAFLSFQLATSSSFYPLKIGQDFQAAYSDNDILRGFKVNVKEGENPLKDKVFSGETIIIPFASTYDRATLIQKYKDVEDSMGIGGSIGVNYKMTVKGKAEADYVQSAITSKKEERVIYSLRRVAYAKKVDIDTIGNATEELNGFLSPDIIADKYGTKFIDQMLYGAQLDIDFKLSSDDEKTMQKIGAKLEGEINLKAIAIDFKANFNLTSEEDERYLKIDITASTSGLPGFSIPANPDITQVIKAIDGFQTDYEKLVKEAKNLTNVGNISNVLKMFSPVGFGLSSISDYQPTLSKSETAALENKMADVADVFYDTLYLKGQLKETKDRQENIYKDPRDKGLWYNPYAKQVDRVIAELDKKVDECLDYQRLPMAVIVGREGNAMVPEPNAIDRDIVDGLLGNTFLPNDVTILNTEFKNKHYVGFGLKVDEGKQFCEACEVKPWLSGSLREVNSDDGSYLTIATEDTPGKLVKSAKEKIELGETKLRIYTIDQANDDEKQFTLNKWTGEGTPDSPNLESFKVSNSGSLGFEYKAYLEDLGLQDWKSSGFIVNPTNTSKFMEAFAIRIDGKTQHSVSYAAKIEHPEDGIVTTRKFRDGEVCCIHHGGNECLKKAPIKAIFVTIETKQQYAPCQRSSPCLCEDSICHDETETTSHAPSTVPSLHPTTSPTRSKETRPPTPNPTPDPTPYPTPNPTPDPTPYRTPNPTPDPTPYPTPWPDSWAFPYWPKWEIDCSTRTYNFSNYKFAIRSRYNTYIRALPGGAGTNVDLQTYIGSSENFVFEDAGNGKHAIRSYHGTYIRARSGGAGANVDLQTFIGSEEKFYIKDAGYGMFSFKSSRNTYIRAMPGGAGSNVELQTFMGSGEKFYLIRLGGGSGGKTKEIVRCS